MSTPHKHAELIKAWADGAVIQYKDALCDVWTDTSGNRPAWITDAEYRVKPTPDPLKEFKEAFFAGKVVEWQGSRGHWQPVETYCAWNPQFNYRLKPVHKWQHLIDAQSAGKACQMQRLNGDWADGDFVFDGVDRKYRLKPEMIKFRNFLWRSCFGGDVVTSVCTFDSHTREDRTKWKGFIHWIGDWQEVEVPTT